MNKVSLYFYSVTMMSRLTNFFFTASLIFTPVVSAQEIADDFKVAVVDIQQVFKSYYKTALTQKEIDRERARIQKLDHEARLEMKRSEDQVRVLSKQLTEGEISPEERAKIQSQREMIINRLRRYNDERNIRYQNANRDLDDQMKSKMRGLLDEIRTLVKHHAKNENYAIVFDRSGTNTNQVPALMYGKNMTNITAVLMKKINKEQPKKSFSK
ncbi:OmpH family outer membrane protein [Akkermansiaceae bacterium]|nr:OmpH family outer membrane protein [Akkermansiaceae bacterium]